MRHIITITICSDNRPPSLQRSNSTRWLIWSKYERRSNRSAKIMQLHRNCCPIGVSSIVSEAIIFWYSMCWLMVIDSDSIAFSFLFFCVACTAERFFRIDRSQETLHYLTDIASDTMYILDQEVMTLPQTPDGDGDDVAVSSSGLPSKRNINFSSGSSDNLERESHENTPTSPHDCQSFFNRLSTATMTGSNSTDFAAMDYSHGKCKQFVLNQQQLQHQQESSTYSVAHALSLIHTNAFCSEDSHDSQNSRQNSPKLLATTEGPKDGLADANVSFDRMVNFKR